MRIGLRFAHADHRHRPWLGRPVHISDQLVYPPFGITLVGGTGYWLTSRAAFVLGVLIAGVVLVLLFARVHETIHHPGLNPRLERQPWFRLLARHHYVHHLDTEVKAAAERGHSPVARWGPW